MSDESIPSYSEAGLSVRDIFFSSGYSVHFFVEDTKKENLYETIFNRLFKRIGGFKVLPLGGKTAVLAHAATDSEVEGVKRVYVLDKDFDDLHDKKIEDPRIFYLDDYCVEGAILDESSLVRLAIEESPTVRRDDIVARISFDSTIKVWISQLDRLHRAFFLVQRYAIPSKNCDSSVFEFCVNRRQWAIDSAKIDCYVDAVANALVASGDMASVQEYSDFSRKAFVTARLQRRHISGKYLQDLFIALLRHKGLVRGSIRTDSVTIRLARSSRLTRLASLRARVCSHLSSAAA